MPDMLVCLGLGTILAMLTLAAALCAKQKGEIVNAPALAGDGRVPVALG